MADDITARIMIAVEYANIDQQCEEIAAALGKVTQARQEDLSTAQKAAAGSREHAEALHQEAEECDFSEAGMARHRQRLKEEADAARKAAEAQRALNVERKTQYEPGISVDEAWKKAGLSVLSEEEKEAVKKRQQEILDAENRRIDEAMARNEQAEQRKADAQKRRAREAFEADVKAQKEAAKEMLFARKEVEAQAQEFTVQRAAISEAAAQKELADIDLKIAKQKHLEAIKAESHQFDNFQAAKGNLALEVAKGDSADPRKVVDFTAALENQEKKLLAAKRATLLAEQGVKKAELSVKNAAQALKLEEAEKRKTTMLTRKLTFALRDMGLAMRYATLRAINATAGTPRMGAKATGAGLFKRAGGGDTGGKGVGGVGNAAFIGIFGAVAIAQKIGSNIREAREQADQLFTQQLKSLREVSERISKKRDETLRSLDQLESFSQKDTLSNLDRFNQSQIIEKLSSNLHSMSISVDAATGKIQKLAELRIEGDLASANAKRQSLVNRLSFVQDRIATHNSELARISLAEEWAGSLVGVRTAQYHRDNLERLRSEEAQIMDDLAELQIVSPDNIEKEREKRYKTEKRKNEAILKDLQIQWKDEIERNQEWRLSRELYGDKRQINTRKRIIGEQRLADLQDKKIKIDAEISKEEAIVNNPQSGYKDAANAAERLKNLAQERINILRKIDTIEKAEYGRMLEFERINKDLTRDRSELRIQELKINGRHAEAKELAKQLEIYRKIKNEGYTEQQITEWKDIQDRRDKLNYNKQRRESFAAMAKDKINLRDTSQNAVLANSIEALRLQSRMLVHNAPQQKLYNLTRQQYNVVAAINKKITKSGSSPSFTVVTP